MIIEEFLCTGPCGEVKPATDFWVDKKHNRRLRQCRKCTNAVRRKRYQLNPEPMKIAAREYRLANPEKAKGTARRYFVANRDKARVWGRKSAVKNRASINRKGRERWAALRAEVIAAYGGKCHCCTETIISFLNLDHVAQDGAKHRKQFNGSNVGVYRWAKVNGYPSTLRIACFNCNIASFRNGGICPHQMGVLKLVVND